MTHEPAEWGSPPGDAYGDTNPTRPIPPAYGADSWRPGAGHDTTYLPYAYPGPKTNGMAIASLVLSISAIFCGVTAILGIICGHIALGHINRYGEHGRGLAVAGLVIGYVLVVLFLVFVGMVLLLSAANNAIP